jgi:hypothetical protein
MIKQLQKQLQAAQENANNLNKDKLNNRKTTNDLIHQAAKVAEQKQDNPLVQAQHAKQEARATINAISAECDEKLARVAMQMEQDQQAHDAVLRLKDSKFKQHAADIQEMKKNLHKQSASLKATAENAIMKVREETSLEIESMNERLEATVSRLKSTIAEILATAWEKISETKKSLNSKVLDKNETILSLTKRFADEKEELNAMMNELSNEYMVAKREAKVADGHREKAQSLAQDRLIKLRCVKEQIRDLRDMLASLTTQKRELQNTTADIQAIIYDLEDTILEYKSQITDLQPRVVTQIRHPGGGLQWPHHVVDMIVVLLANRVPPSSIAATISNLALTLLPNQPIVQQLPSTRFIQLCRTTLLHTTKTLAAYQLAAIECYDELFTNGTSRRHTALENVIIGFMTDNGF